MQACTNLDRSLSQTIVQRIGKSREKQTSQIPDYDGRYFWHLTDKREARAHGLLKLQAETRTLPIVPPNGVGDVAGG